MVTNRHGTSRGVSRQVSHRFAARAYHPSKTGATRLARLSSKSSLRGPASTTFRTASRPRGTGFSAGQGMVRTGRNSGAMPELSGAKMMVLVASLIGGACLMAAAVASRDFTCLGWFCLLPVFIAIRRCTPSWAGLCGALWGACLYVFLQIGTDAAAPTLAAGALAMVVPALYANLAARLTRWVGYSPFVLAVGWMGVELASIPLGLRGGLLAGTQGGGTLMAWVGQGLGYVFVAFIVAVVNASLVTVLSGLRLTLPQWAHGISVASRRAALLPQTFVCIPFSVVSPSQPRAPRSHANRSIQLLRPRFWARRKESRNAR